MTEPTLAASAIVQPTEGSAVLIQLATRLRIGEKIALGLSILGLLFLGVIWHDRSILKEVIEDSTHLQSVYGARQSYAFRIERRLAAMRGAEQAFLARRDPEQAAELLRQADGLDAEAAGLARLDADSARAADQIRALAQDYRTGFEAIANAWRARGLDHDAGLQGAFRDSAHELEALAGRHSLQVPGLELLVLQLRRREKDYLLRGDSTYVEMVDSIAAELTGRIESSLLDAPDRAELSGLLDAYTRDFHALVDQDRQIAALARAMDAAASRITPLVAANLDQAQAELTLMSERLARDSATRARRGLMVALGAAALGALLALLLTVRIVRPVRAMAGLLDRLTHESPSERIAVDPDGRDEINHMAIALNTLADHRARLIQWWRTSMQEAAALRELRPGADPEGRQDAEGELDQARRAKAALLFEARDHIAAQAQRVAAVAERLEGRGALTDGAALREAAADIVDHLEMLEAVGPVGPGSGSP